jgi:hypothetical protein
MGEASSLLMEIIRVCQRWEGACTGRQITPRIRAQAARLALTESAKRARELDPALSVLGTGAADEPQSIGPTNIQSSNSPDSGRLDIFWFPDDVVDMLDMGKDKRACEKVADRNGYRIPHLENAFDKQIELINSTPGAPFPLALRLRSASDRRSCRSSRPLQKSLHPTNRHRSSRPQTNVPRMSQMIYSSGHPAIHQGRLVGQQRLQIMAIREEIKTFRSNVTNV